MHEYLVINMLTTARGFPGLNRLRWALSLNAMHINFRILDIFDPSFCCRRLISSLLFIYLSCSSITG